MARTNIDIDDELVAAVMKMYRLDSKRSAVDFALRRLAGAPMSRGDVLAMQGTGFEFTNDEIESFSSVDVGPNDEFQLIVDTSAWIEFFNSSTSNASRWLRKRTAEGSSVVVPELVMTELLIGTTSESRASDRLRLLQYFGIEPLAPIRDAEHAATIHRQCRRGGDTVRSTIDCLIAAMALRLELPVAHRDRDFEVIAEHCGLQTVPLF